MTFWNEHILADKNEYDLEIDELIMIYKTVTGVHEKNMLELINYFFPLVEIEENKFVQNVRCTFWNKKEEIKNALDIFRQQSNTTRSPSPDISIYELYEYYCKRQKHLSLHKWIVNKQYFEKYVAELLNEYLVDEQFISNEWFIL